MSPVAIVQALYNLPYASLRPSSLYLYLFITYSSLLFFFFALHVFFSFLSLAHWAEVEVSRVSVLLRKSLYRPLT